MRLLSINWSPSPNQIKQFGICCLVLLPFLGWWWNVKAVVLAGLGAIGLCLAVAAWFAPRLVRPMFVGLMVVTAPIGMILGELAMTLIFVGIFCPIACVFRWLRRDALKIRMDKKAKSYWQTKQTPQKLDRYFRRF
jgi:hypothetical protein